MKTSKTIIAVSAALVANAAAQAPPALGVAEAPATAAEVGVLPTQKEEMVQKYLVDAEERNPFATNNPVTAPSSSHMLS